MACKTSKPPVGKGGKPLPFGGKKPMGKKPKK